jgi:hypothetical protein
MLRCKNPYYAARVTHTEYYLLLGILVCVHDHIREASGQFPFLGFCVSTFYWAVKLVGVCQVLFHLTICHWSGQLSPTYQSVCRVRVNWKHVQLLDSKSLNLVRSEHDRENGEMEN